VERPRAADDFDVIRERLEELRREREEVASKQTPGESPSGSDDSVEGRKERCEDAPPAWVPTIFSPQPTD